MDCGDERSVCVVAIAAVVLFSGGWGFYPTIPQVRALFITGILLAIHWLTFFESVQLAGVAIATLTFAARPLFTVLFETMKARRRASLLELGARFAIVVAVSVFFGEPLALWVVASGALIIGSPVVLLRADPVTVVFD